MSHASTLTTIVTGLALAATFVACGRETFSLNPDHCRNNDGDAYCAAMFPDKPFCTSGEGDCQLGGDDSQFGCVAEAPSDDCAFPCGNLDPAECEDDTIGSSMTMTTTGMDTETTTEDTDLTQTEPTTGPTTQTEPTTDTDTAPECMGSDECMDSMAPICNDVGVCVACNEVEDADMACADKDAATPACGDDGVCVQCTDINVAACDGQTPVCEGANCVGCTEHDQCADSACHLAGDQVGACFLAGEVVDAANTAELEATFNALSADDDLVIRLTGSDYTGVSIDFVTAAEVAVIGEGSQTISGNRPSGLLATGSDATIYLAGASIVSNSSGDGLSCSGESVWLDDAAVRNNAGVGLDISGGCAAHLRRTIVAVNSGGGISAAGDASEVYLTTSVIGGNTNTDSFPAISLQSSADLYTTYSTIADNLAGLGDPDSIVCSGSPEGFVRNSIVLGAEGGSISNCGGLSFENNAVDADGLGATNSNVGPHDDGWFNPSANDYHLSTSGETTFMDIAQWTAADPLADVDGHPIPQDMPSFPGYDQP